MSHNHSHEIAQHYVQNTRESCWTALIFGVASFALSTVPEKYPALFGMLFFLIVLNTTGNFIAMLKFEKQFAHLPFVIGAEDQKRLDLWVKRFLTIRWMVFISLIAMMVLSLWADGLLSPIGLVAVAGWVASIEVLVAYFHPHPRFVYSVLGLLYCAPMGVVLLREPFPGNLLLASFGLMYTVITVSKLPKNRKHFFFNLDLRVRSEEEKNQLENFIDVMPALVAWFDEDGRYRFVNKALAEQLDHERQKNNPVVKSPTPIPLNTILTQAVHNFHLSTAQLEHQFESTVVTNSGPRSFQFYLKKVKTFFGDETVFLGIDTEDQKQMERRLQEQQEKSVAAERMAALGEMGAGIAHEIKNPLTVILGHAGFIQSDLEKSPPDLEKIRYRSHKIEETSHRIVKIIEGLRKLSRDSTEQEKSWISVQELLADPINLFAEKLKNQNIEFEVDMPHPHLQILCQPLQVAQVVLNLISNSRDALESQDQRRIRVVIELSDQNQARIRIIDNGPGVNDINKLFAPFYTTKDPGKGTGLGLSISRKILEKNGGLLRYERSNNETHFILEFPSNSVSLPPKVA